jgi:hypothetical protein
LPSEAVLLDEAKEGVDTSAQTLTDLVRGCLQCRGDESDQLCRLALQQLDLQGSLGWEVVVDHRGRDPRRPCDFPHRGLLVAALGEHPHRTVEDALAALLGAQASALVLGNVDGHDG